MDLPTPLRDADQRLATVLARYRIAEYLNPLNPAEARAAWRPDEAAPSLRYQPVTWADDALRDLDAVRAPADHPLGVVVNLAVEEFRSFVLALRDRTARAFDALARVHAWYPEHIDAPDRVQADADTPERATVSAVEMATLLQRALTERGMVRWSTRLDPLLSSRVLVDSPRREVRVNPRASFRPSDVFSLVAHEIDVHVQRSVNGDAQSLALFRTGLPGALATEEGLAIVAEERVGVTTGHLLDRQALVAAAVLLAREAGFAEVHRMVSDRVGPEAGWAIALRVKRGLACPGAPGVFAKDAVYHIGYHHVRGWLSAGGSLDTLYVGKVGLHHPVNEWIAAGWVVPQRAPTLWSGRVSKRG